MDESHRPKSHWLNFARRALCEACPTDGSSRDSLTCCRIIWGSGIYSAFEFGPIPRRGRV